MSILRLFSSSFLPATALVALLSYATPSRADVLPPDGCTGSAGPSCNNAGPNNDEPGVCVETTCPHRGSTSLDASDADLDAETQEPCVLCQVPDGGSSTGNGSSKSSGGGCSMSPGTTTGGGLGLTLVAGLALGAVRRRRRAV